MSAGVSVVIPTRNEADHVGAAIRSAFAAGASEVIVADGGSSDATLAIAAAEGARIVDGETMRSRQLNRGAQAAREAILLFLHADSRLPPGAAAAVLASGADFGGFRLAFAEPAAKLRIAAALINVRTRLTRCPWGDQAQFVRRDLFLAEGGFREIAIMEDYELARRMKRRGRVALLPLTVTTSARRFLDRGVLRTAVINWWIIARWHAGADADALARLYRGPSSS